MGNQTDGRQNLYSVLIVTWPNLISMARLMSVPVIAWLLLSGHVMSSFVACVLAGLSDILDGFVARWLKSPSAVGAYLDPLADKVLLVGMFLLLGHINEVELWLVLLVISRDIGIIGGTMLLYMLGKPFEVKPSFISKINTVLQIVLVAWILGAMAFNVYLPVVKDLLIYSVMVSTILSGLHYMLLWLRYIAQPEEQA